ncbi:hypothetical protein L914_21792 [Phytophthora nicotianae]|uniref:Uncharacterized protein n=1 Tax=Phytophthora nicotianae TaxID=4792 RepID=W2M4K6_PHYNI|nr:hypothetical protein L914_21792 [Phytophthora nicotianae]
MIHLRRRLRFHLVEVAEPVRQLLLAKDRLRLLQVQLPVVEVSTSQKLGRTSRNPSVRRLPRARRLQLVPIPARFLAARHLGHLHVRLQ